MHVSNWRSVQPLPIPGLRIVHITEAPLGGVLGCIQEIIADHSRRAGVERVYALVPEVNAPPLVAVSSENAEIRSFRHRRGSIMSLLRLATGTIRLVRDVRPDIVHIHSTIAGVVVRIALLAVPGRPQIVYCPHSWTFCGPFGAVVRRVGSGLEFVLSLVTDRIVCVSDFEKRAAIAIGISENKCVVVQNGIADDKPSQSLPSQSLEPRRLRVLFIGRFDRQKGFDTYLEVMSRLEDIADGYAVGGFIVNRAREVSIPANVEISGWKSRDDLDEIYRSADLLLMPSRADSSPLVAMEAMRAGLPVFASRVGGIPEIVIDGETGRLFDPTDIEQAADMIRSVSRTKLQEYGANSRVRFEKHFTATRMSASLLDHYHQLASRRERSALS